LVVFLALQLVAARLFAPRMPDPMITRRSIAGVDSTMPKRFGLWIGPAGSLLLSLVSFATQVRTPATLILLQVIFLIAILYIYAINIIAKRRGER